MSRPIRGAGGIKCKVQTPANAQKEITVLPANLDLGPALWKTVPRLGLDTCAATVPNPRPLGSSHLEATCTTDAV